MYAEDPSNKGSETKNSKRNNHEVRGNETGAQNHTRKAGYKNEHPNGLRIFSCPSCGQKIRVVLPLPSNIGKCSKCCSKFKVSSDKAGNIYIYIIKGSEQQKSSENLTLERCFNVLDIKSSATPSEIKLAYNLKMKEYHPDKVASLGKKLRDVASQESKKINSALKFLKENGYC